jgi:hypothetical protein
VPPHCAELVSLSTAIPIYIEKQVGTWQLIPDIEAEDGDFSSQTKLSTTFDQAQEGVKHRVTFADNLVQNDMEINHKSTQDFGKCQCQSTLIQVDCTAPQGLWF